MFVKHFVVYAATDDRFDPIVVYVFRTRMSGGAVSDPRNICRQNDLIMFVSQLMFRYWFGHQLSKRKELPYNLGAISTYSTMMIFFVAWH